MKNIFNSPEETFNFFMGDIEPQMKGHQYNEATKELCDIYYNNMFEELSIYFIDKLQLVDEFRWFLFLHLCLLTIRSNMKRRIKSHLRNFDQSKKLYKIIFSDHEDAVKNINDTDNSETNMILISESVIDEFNSDLLYENELIIKNSFEKILERIKSDEKHL